MKQSVKLVRSVGLLNSFFIGMTEILVPIGKKSSVVLKNAFSSITDMEILRTQWLNRTLYTDYVRDFVKSRDKLVSYYGVVVNQNNLSISVVDSHGMVTVVSEQ